MDIQTVDPLVQRDLERLLAGTVKCETPREMYGKLARSRATGKPLIIKAGFDPTAADLHLGHTVVLNKMRTFQELGHRVVFVIGDFTAMIGDPTGRNEARKPLTEDEIRRNAETYTAQVFKVLDPDRTEVRFNSEWLRPLGAEGLIRLAARYTVSRILERDDFKKRFQDEAPIGIHEFLYPLLQGYDSVALQADVELGGSDQLFNLLVGRALQRDHAQEPQVVMTMPLLEGTDARMVDGVLAGAKMSKSLGNYIGVTEAPTQQFLKVLSVSDDLMWRYYELLSRRAPEEVAAMRDDCKAHRKHPRDVKETLAVELVERFHGKEAADAAKEAGNRWLRERVSSSMQDIPVTAPTGGIPLAVALKEAGIAQSSSEARRRIAEGAVWVDDVRATGDGGLLMPGTTYTVRYGKKVAARLVVNHEII
jgi:tyrosyl-tRNA synthetase